MAVGIGLIRHVERSGIIRDRIRCLEYCVPIRLADNFCVPGSATVSVAPVDVSTTGILPINRIGMEYWSPTQEAEVVALAADRANMAVAAVERA
jgi:hypothetical protein